MTAAATPETAYDGDLDWMVDAACRGADPERFFPGVAGQMSLRSAADVAWRHCQRCPVLARCHDLAERTDAVGIWAGSLRRRDTTTGGIDRIPIVPAAPKREAT